MCKPYQSFQSLTSKNYMHGIIERMEYLFPPLSYLTHHSALSGLLYLSQTLYLPGSHIHMSPSRYIDPSNTLRSYSLSL